MERKLNNSIEGKKFEVIVLAENGYSTIQELILLKNEAFDYHPDLIIWSYALNDPAHPVYHNANNELGRYFFKPKLHILSFVSYKLFALNEKRKGQNCGKEFHKFLHCVYWDQIDSYIKQIGEVSRDKSTPIIFLISPVFQKNRSFSDYTLTSIHIKLANLSSEVGLIPLDLLDAFKPYGPDELKQHRKDWYDPWHPNAKGHMVMADYIYKRIEEGEYIGKKRSDLKIRNDKM